MDLLSVVLTLKPLAAQPAGAPADLPAPFWWGRAAQSMFLSVIAETVPALAARLHDEQGPHPYTVSTLTGRFRGNQLDLESTYALRITAIEQDLAERLEKLTAPGGPLGPGAGVELDRRPFRVECAARSPSEHPWAGSSSYAELAAAQMARSEAPPRRVALRWASPAAFRSQGRDVPLPVPEMVFGSLLERWNAFSPVAFPPETRRYAAECLGVTRYELKTRSVPVKEGALRVGAVGHVSFATFSFDRYWMSVLHALAAFSLYSGVGVLTAQGMGQCRVLE